MKLNMRKIHEILKSYYIPVLILFLWQIASALEIWNAYLLPPPWKVARTFWNMLLRGEIAVSVAVSLRRVLLGFGISFALAFLCGLVAAYLPDFAAYFRHVGNFFRNVPPLALISIFILWFGLGEASKLMIIILASFFPMEMNIAKGFASVDRRLLEVGESLGFSKFRSFLLISLPAARQDILIGMRVGLGYSWRALIGAEMFAASAGLGYMIVFAQQMSRSDKVLIGIFLIGGIGCLSDYFFALILDKFETDENGARSADGKEIENGAKSSRRPNSPDKESEGV